MAIVNKFGGNVQVAGSVISYVVVVGAPVTTAYPVQINATLDLASGSPENVIVNAALGSTVVTLPAPSQDNEGESFTIRCSAVNAPPTFTVGVHADGGTVHGAYSENLAAANDFVTFVCENQLVGTTPAWGWALVSTNL